MMLMLADDYPDQDDADNGVCLELGSRVCTECSQRSSWWSWWSLQMRLHHPSTRADFTSLDAGGFNYLRGQH